MEEYRRTVAEALDFVLGEGDGLIGALREEMKKASAALEFERAAGIKARLERLGELVDSLPRGARTLDEFRFVIVQPGGSRQEARAFLACRGHVEDAPALKYPPDGRQLSALLKRMEWLDSPQAEATVRESQTPLGTRRMGLVSSYMFSSERRRGLIWRWSHGASWEGLAEAIEATHSAAVDVAGGVEVSPGVKDRQLVERFVAAARGSLYPQD